MSDSVRSHRRKPTRLPRPWDSPGKNTGVGCHFLLQCMKVKSEREVAQSCPTLSDLIDCSPPGSSVNGIFHARVLEWAAIAFSVDYPRLSKSVVYNICLPNLKDLLPCCILCESAGGFAQACRLSEQPLPVIESRKSMVMHGLILNHSSGK